MTHTSSPKNPQHCATPGRLSVAVALATLTLNAGIALAQDEPRKGYSLMLEEVLVTAQKREEDNMSVPITVNAFTAADMVKTGALDIQDIDNFMPGVEIGADSATQVEISIRGIESPNISTGGDPSIATFYDSAYVPRAATSIPFTDIARTEVLKGPQGTLFGRNATAGVINIVPNRPGMEFEGFVKTRIGSEGLVRLEGMVNAPVTDDLALRGNVFFHERNAILDNVGVGDDLREEGFLAARVSALYNISADTDVQFAFDLEDRDEHPRYSIGVSKYAESMDPYNSKVANDVAGRQEGRDMIGTSVQLNHSFNEELSMFGIVSYREWDTVNLQDEDGTADIRRYLDSNNIEESDIWYTEFRFNFVNDRWNVVTGANYSAEDVYQRTNIGITADSYMQFVSGVLLPEVGIQPTLDDHAWDLDLPFLRPNNMDDYIFASEFAEGAVIPESFSGLYFTETMDNTGDFVNWGVFGDATYQLTDTVRLIAGLRYSYDDKEFSWQTFSSGIDWPFEPFRVAYDPVQTGADPAQYLSKFEDSKDWSKTTGRLVVDWEICDDTLTYLSYATGYKSGGFDGQVFSAVVAGPFEPEEITSLEWGLKGDYLDNTLRIEAAVFYHELDNQQKSVETTEGPDDPTAQPTIVSQDVQAEGIELIVQWHALDSLLLTGMTTVRDAEEDPEAFFDAQGMPDGGVKEKTSTNTDYTLRLDWTPEVPTGALLVHLDYVYEEADDESDAVIFTTGRWYFRDKKLLSGRIAWQNDADNIEVAVWGTNLLDEEYADNPGGFAAEELGVFKTNIEDPRAYGFDLRYSF